MADCDLLRHVEVISTVSGGSIVGALYYLKLKRLYETKPDHALTREDYQDLVADLTEHFTKAVQTNIRLRTFLNPLKNLRMRRPDYSRSDRIAELYDELLYRPVFGPDRETPVMMRELLIQPVDAEGLFHPDSHNRRRRAKVPVLLINATTLNTGRNWRFEAIRMGEPPRESLLQNDVDKRFRLVRPEGYGDITPVQRDIPLGHAVAASAAVPGLFHPLAISGLYKGVRVELVDGGVHDNQGVQGLIDRNCNQFIVSDGSGQMRGEAHPGASIPSVLLRSNEILMSRVREEQILRTGGADPRSARDASLCFLHLLKGIEPGTVAYIDATGKPARPKTRPVSKSLERYGTAPEVQEALSRVRTDLDAFNQAEAHSLMLNGYNMAKFELRAETGIWGRRGNVRPREWSFQDVRTFLASPSKRYMRVLRAASSNVFKVFMLYPSLTAAASLIGFGLFAWLAWTYRDRLWQPIVSERYIPSAAWLLAGAAALALGTQPAGRLISAIRGVQHRIAWLRRPVLWVHRLLFRSLPSIGGAVFIWGYLALLNPLYLKAGAISTLRLRRPVSSDRRKSLLLRRRLSR